MDMSLLKPLSEILNVSINEILQGEYIKDNQLDKSEQNIINTINYSEKKVNEKNKLIGIILIVFGIILTITAMTIFNSDSSWGSIYSVVGGIISLIGISKLTKKIGYGKRLIVCLGYFTFYLITLIIIDYLSVISLKVAPRFCFSVEYYDNLIIYRALFYDVYKVNKDSQMEYIIVDTKNEYTKDTVPILPFNINDSGIEKILNYQNNVDDLLHHLPLKEYSFNYELQKNNGLIINYSVASRYIDDHFYVEKSLFYNSISLFSLIDNLEYINFNFLDKKYRITKNLLEEKFDRFKEIENKYLDKVTTYKMYIYNNINDDDFINYYFKIFFLDEKLKKANKIIVKNRDKLIKTITSKNDISKILCLFEKGRHLPYNAIVTSEGNLCEIYFYDNNNLIESFLFFLNGSYGNFGKEYKLDTKSTDELLNLLR